MGWQPGGRRVVYTAIIGGYDGLLAPPVTTGGWSYVCFSDRELSCPPWEVVRVETRRAEDFVRSARRLKVLAHRTVPDAAYSLWVDGNVEVSCDLDRLVEDYLDGSDLAAHPHPQRNCLFDEATAILEAGKDAPRRVLPHALRYARARFPREAGLIATGVLLRRHTASMARFERRWWREIEAGSHRDQLSVMVALRSAGLVPALFESDIWRGPLFTSRPHNGARTRRSQSRAFRSVRA